MSITIVCGFLMYALVFLRSRADASIFTSSLVLTYALYLQWTAMSSSPALDGTGSCNPYYGENQQGWNRTFTTILGLIFTFISLMIISAYTTKEESTYKRATGDQVNVA